MASVRLDNIKKVYDNSFTAVHNATVEIQNGEFVVLVGPSGCGKSTTLRMIAGLESITEGALYIDDNRVNDVAPKDRDIAMVFQNYALYPHMTVKDNMAFGLKLRKYKKSEIASRVEHAAEILGIDSILDRKPKQLSGGQRQRVAVGRAIVRKPKVFLFDEPLSNLDAKLRVQMRTEISKLHQQLESTMVYVTHDQVEAMTMGDRIVVMKDGYIQQIDTPLNLYNNPANVFVGGFIGSPSMNFMNGVVAQKDGLVFRENGTSNEIKVPASRVEILKSYVDKPIVIGVRPESVSLAPVASSANAGDKTISVSLDVIEPMGNEIIIYSDTGSHRLVARLVPQELPPPGSRLELAVDVDKVHFFDANTESAIV
ncbi:MAG: sn-glycerol-3-phosphate ABC transporter ATP-binding protein UgpC [Rhodothermaceae bacterium]|nr:sn-glycerol-3-phosphate ABC transporter ATP-binding protein UgpC [Rhodothermaceae bacterium]